MRIFKFSLYNSLGYIETRLNLIVNLSDIKHDWWLILKIKMLGSSMMIHLSRLFNQPHSRNYEPCSLMFIVDSIGYENAFLHSELQETMCMHQSSDFIDPICLSHVCNLGKIFL